MTPFCRGQGCGDRTRGSGRKEEGRMNGEEGHRNEHSSPTKMPPLSHAPHSHPPAPFSRCRPLCRPAACKLSRQVFLGPEAFLWEKQRAVRPQTACQAGSAPAAESRPRPSSEARFFGPESHRHPGANPSSVDASLGFCQGHLHLLSLGGLPGRYRRACRRSGAL